MKRFVEGEDRRQATLLPECLDDHVAEDNPVRVVEVFTDELDLGALGFEGVVPEATGRPSYHPSTMLKLYLYGYMNRVQSSRRLEREAGRNTAQVWLTGRLAPDFKTIADFRRDNGPAIGAVCGRFVALCRRLDLFTQAVVAVDGSKFKAVNDRDKNYTAAKVAKRMEQADASVARHLAALDRADREKNDVAEAKASRNKEKIAGLRRQMQLLKEMRHRVEAAPDHRVEAAPDQQVSLTDPDARSMATSGRGTGVVGHTCRPPSTPGTALVAALSGLMADGAISCLVLTGTDDAFCAGGDLTTMEDRRPEAVRSRLGAAHAWARLLLQGEGAAAGAGFSLAMLCDLMLMSETAYVQAGFPAIGAVPDLGLALTLPRAVGMARARELLLTNRRVPAAEAVAMGMALRACPPLDLLPQALDLAGAIAAGPRPSTALTKLLLARAYAPAGEFLREEAMAQAIAFGSEDFAEGVQASFDRRKPAFGRSRHERPRNFAPTTLVRKPGRFAASSFARAPGVLRTPLGGADRQSVRAGPGFTAGDAVGR